PCPFERDLEELPHRFFVINEQDGRHPFSHPFPGLVADQDTRILCSCRITREGLLLAEWPGERADGRASSPSKLVVGDTSFQDNRASELAESRCPRLQDPCAGVHREFENMI